MQNNQTPETRTININCSYLGLGNNIRGQFNDSEIALADRPLQLVVADANQLIHVCGRVKETTQANS